jgi:hypothetical protein
MAGAQRAAIKKRLPQSRKAAKIAKIAKERKGKREKLEIGYWGRGIGD